MQREAVHLLYNSHDSSSFSFSFSFFCLFMISVVKSCEGQVGHLASIARNSPALYVFGDSTVSCGYGFLDVHGLNSPPPPYGIDSYEYITRYTNGYNVADELSMNFNLSTTTPHWLSHTNPNITGLTGLNYASAFSGILPHTASTTTGTMNMEKQIMKFKETIANFLPQRLNSTKEIPEYLSNSMYIISTGTHDFLENFPPGYNYHNDSNGDTSVEFTNLLISHLQEYLKELYRVGARKMIVFEVGPIGCYPVMAGKDKSKSGCSNEVNDMISFFNAKLYHKLVELTSTLEGTTFILAKAFKFIYDMEEYPYKYKFVDSKHPCCEVDEDAGVQCVFWTEPCKSRNEWLFWDKIHLTWRANTFFALKCMEDPGLCLPVTFNKLEGAVIIESGMPAHRHNFLVCLIQAIIVFSFLYIL